jgi:hypothetical protein
VELHRPPSLFLQDAIRRARVFVAISLLRDAQDAARDLGVDVWEFAVEGQHLLAAGLSRTDLRWLVGKGYAMYQAAEALVERLCPHSFCPHLASVTPECSRFVLTGAGFNAWLAWQGGAPLDGVVASEMSSRTRDALPRWAGDLRELSWKGVLVKRFRGPAANQEALVAAFAEEGWPPRIDDPLPPAVDMDPKTRLHDTIKALNRHQLRPLLRFRGDGTGRGVWWSAVTKSEPRLPEGT